MQAVFITAILPAEGTQVCCLHPDRVLTADETIELSLKSMPMGGKEGDFSSVVFKDFQIASLLTIVPPIDETADPRDTYVSLGFLLDLYENPVPYRDFLIEFVKKLKIHRRMTLPVLERIFPELSDLKKNNKVCLELDKGITISLELQIYSEKKKGLKLLDDTLWG